MSTSIEPIEEDQLLIMLQHAPTGICVIDARTLVIEIANPIFVEVSGKRLDEMLGKPYWEAFAEAASIYEKELQKVIDENKPYFANEVNLTLIRHGHEEAIWVTFVYQPVVKNGEVNKVAIYVVEKTSDIRIRRQIEKEVAERTQELEKTHVSLLNAKAYAQHLLNLSNSAIQVLEPIYHDGKIIDFSYKITNAAYAAYANATPDLLVGKRVGDVFPGYFQTASFANVEKTFRTGISETWENHYDQDGLNIYNQMSATKMDNEVVVHFTEITKLKQLQLELLSKIEELERSNQNLEEFAHAASHDLKEPIRKVKTFMSILKQQLVNRLSPDELHNMGRIENAVDRMGALVDDLLVYSHVSIKPIEKETVDLNKKIQQVIEDLELSIAEQQAVITTENLPVLQGYKRQLQQMFQNLISNAIKYSKVDEHPHINISGHTEEISEINYHVITVADNGIGFEQQYAEKIFQLFTRLHGKSDYGGTGIGLSIVRKVVENHHGFVRAESEPGKGARFRIYLPY